MRRKTPFGHSPGEMGDRVTWAKCTCNTRYNIVVVVRGQRAVSLIQKQLRITTGLRTATADRPSPLDETRQLEFTSARNKFHALRYVLCNARDVTSVPTPSHRWSAKFLSVCGSHFRPIHHLKIVKGKNL